MVEVIVPESLQTGSLVEDAQTLIKEENLTEDGVEKEQKINKLKKKLSSNPPPNKRTKSIREQISNLEKKLEEDDDLTIIY